MGFFDFFTSDIAIDLGTANTLVIHKDRIVVDQPSIIAMNKITGKVMAIGTEAMQMHEKTHDNIKTIRPLKDGVIADFTAAEQMIRGMIKMIHKSGSLFAPAREVDAPVVNISRELGWAYLKGFEHGLFDFAY